jgi:hypothetical protein
MKRNTTIRLLAILAGVLATGMALYTQAPQQAFAQSSSTAAGATDFGSSASGAGANFFDGESGAASASGEDALAAGGGFADCFFADAVNGGCAVGFR